MQVTTSKKSEKADMGDPTRQYYRFWSGQVMSLIGSSVVQFTIIWWITIIYQSSFYLGLAFFFGFGSVVLTNFFAGVFADWWNRKWIIGIADFLQALTTLFIFFLFFVGFDTIWVILFFLGIKGLFQGFHRPALGAIIPDIIPEEGLQRINGIMVLSNGVSELIGPVIAAFLLGVVRLENVHFIFLIDGLTFLFAVIPLVYLKIPQKNRAEKVQSSYLTDFREGVRYLQSRKILLLLMILSPLANFFLSPLQVLLPLLVIDPQYFDAGVDLLALSLVFFNVGFILSSLLMSSFSVFKREILGIALSILIWITGIVIVVSAAILKLKLLLYLGQLVIGITFPVHNITVRTLWHKIIPSQYQGRVLSLRRTSSQITYPVALFLAGVFASFIHPLVIIISGIFLMGIFLVHTWFFTDFKFIGTENRP